jgi:hypothetical protein
MMRKHSSYRVKRLVAWGTGNMGSAAIRSCVVFPGLELVGIITSSAEKAGQDAAALAGLHHASGVVATTDIGAALADCDAVAYMASGDVRPDEAAADSHFEKGSQGAFCAPDWPQPDQGAGDHRLIIDGDPRLEIVVRADVPGGTLADGANTTTVNRLLGAIDWIVAQKPGIYDGSEVPLSAALPAVVGAERWRDD